jgi:hypothetical protein
MENETDEGIGLVYHGWATSKAKYIETLYKLYRANNVDLERIWTQQDGKCPGCREELAHPYVKTPQTAHKPKAYRDIKTNGLAGFTCGRCGKLLKDLKTDEGIFRRLISHLSLTGQHHE